MSGKALTNKEADKILKENGFKLLRKKGDHLVYGHVKSTSDFSHGMN